MDLNLPQIVAEVTECFERYEDALVSNDLEVLSQLFWQSPLVVRFGLEENLYGYDEIAAYRRRRPTNDLSRKLTHTIVTTYGHDFATTSVEFCRLVSGTIGRQSQCWVRTEVGWRIVAAHVSDMVS